MRFLELLVQHKLLTALISLALVGGVGGSWYLVAQKNRTAPVQAAATATPQPGMADKVIPTAPPDLNLPDATPTVASAHAEHLGVLLLGYGGAGHDGGYLTDTIVLAYLDVPHKTLSLIHIPRDTWVSIPLNGKNMPMKINAALAMGTKTGNYPTKDVPKDAVLRGSYLSKVAVKTVTGLAVDYVVGVDFNTFPQAINALGGVDLNLTAPFSDPWYPIRGEELNLCGKTPEEVTQLSNTLSGFELEKQFPCRYEQLQFNPGLNHLDGDTALKYARSRHSTSDFDRGVRQMSVILAAKDKLLSLHALDKIPQFFTTLSRSIKTDLSIDNVTVLEPILKSIPSLKIIQINLDTTNVLTNSTGPGGAYILLPKSGENNWSDTHTYISTSLSK